MSDLSLYSNEELADLWQQLEIDLETLMKLNEDQLAQLHHTGRNTVTTLEERLKVDKTYAKAKEAIRVVDSLLMQRLQDTGATSIATPNGTIHTVGKTTARVDDPVTFSNWVFENDERDAIECKANMTYARDYKEKHGHEPPGVQLVTYYRLSITAPKAPMKRLSDGK